MAECLSLFFSIVFCLGLCVMMYVYDSRHVHFIVDVHIRTNFGSQFSFSTGCFIDQTQIIGLILVILDAELSCPSTCGFSLQHFFTEPRAHQWLDELASEFHGRTRLCPPHQNMGYRDKLISLFDMSAGDQNS